MTNSITIQGKALTLAHQIKSEFKTFSEALIRAWELVKENEVEIIEFIKKSTKKVTKRVITRNLTKYWKSVGGTSNSPETIKVIDLAKVVKKSYSTMISFYSQNLVSVAS